MNKLYTGLEILQMMRDLTLKENTKLTDKYNNTYIYTRDKVDELILLKIEGKHRFPPDYSLFIDNEFKIKYIEIDINNIEELEVIDFINTPGEKLTKEENIRLNNQILVDYFYIINDIIKNQNHIVQVVKQFNDEIIKMKELKEK